MNVYIPPVYPWSFHLIKSSPICLQDLNLPVTISCIVGVLKNWDQGCSQGQGWVGAEHLANTHSLEFKNRKKPGSSILLREKSTHQI